MKLEVNYLRSKPNKELDKSIANALEKIGAKQYCKGFRTQVSERYIWFDLADEEKFGK